VSNLTIAGWRKSYGAGGRTAPAGLIELVPNLGELAGSYVNAGPPGSQTVRISGPSAIVHCDPVQLAALPDWLHLSGADGRRLVA
jgi:hypothetical protein